jgi:hypothetical protein
MNSTHFFSISFIPFCQQVVSVDFLDFSEQERAILPCVSNKTQPHDVVRTNTCLETWVEVRKKQGCHGSESAA